MIVFLMTTTPQRKAPEMLMQTRLVLALGFAFGLSALAGCGSGELGPADPSQVPTVDPAEIQKEINREEATKHLPEGAKIPAGVMPADPSSNPPSK